MQNRKRLPLLLTALMLVFCIALTGCAGRRSVTAEDFSAACETAGFEVTDASESFDASVILTALTVTDESVSAGLFVFASADSARSNYAQMLSGVKTGASGEKFVDSSEYNRYTYKGDDLTTVLYRNGTTILFATGADKDTVNKVVTALGL